MDITNSSLKLLVAKIGRAIITFGGIFYFARHLGAAHLGTFFMFQAALELLALPTDLGLRGAMEKRISEGNNSGSFLLAASLLKLPPLLIISSLILIFSDIVNGYLGANLVEYLVIGLFIQEYSRLLIKVLNGELRAGETAILLLLQRIVWVGSGIILINAGYGTLGLVYGLLIGFSVMLVGGWIKKSISMSHPDRSHFKSLYSYAKYNVVAQTGGAMYSWMDVAIIGFFLPPAFVGAYEVSWRLTAVVAFFGQSLAIPLFPQISKWNAEGAKNRIEDLLPEIVTWSLIPVIPAFVGTLLLSKHLLHYLFGSEYIIAWLALIILMGEKVPQAIHLVFGRSLLGIDRPDLAARATIIAVSLNIGLNFILVPYFGLAGAAFATAISFGVNTLLHARYLSQLLTINLQYYEISWSIVASIFMMIILLLLLNTYLVIKSIPTLIATVGLGVVVYTSLILVNGRIRYQMMKIISI